MPSYLTHADADDLPEGSTLEMCFLLVNDDPELLHARRVTLHSCYTHIVT